MIGPLPVRRVALCTGPPDSAVARYFACRLTRELPGVDVRVWFQTGDKAAAAPKPKPAFTFDRLKTLYWAARRWVKRLKANWWRWRYFVRTRGRVDALLNKRCPIRRTRLQSRVVASVNRSVEELRDLAPDVLLIFGGGVLSEDVLNSAGLALNIHCGKLPEYRGVCSVLFALNDDRPDMIGTSLHVATKVLDGGELIDWRPVALPQSGSMADLLCRLYETGVDTALEALRRLPDCALSTRAHEGAARCFRSCDLSPDVIQNAYAILSRHRRSGHRLEAALEGQLQLDAPD